LALNRAAVGSVRKGGGARRLTVAKRVANTGETAGEGWVVD